jgi:hypothetical protein
MRLNRAIQTRIAGGANMKTSAHEERLRDAQLQIAGNMLEANYASLVAAEQTKYDVSEYYSVIAGVFNRRSEIIAVINGQVPS